MAPKIKPYPDCKHSSVEWLGDIPAHWEVRRLKYVATLNPSRTESRNSLAPDTAVTFLPMERVGSDGQIYPQDTLSASKVWNGFTYFRRDDVLVAKITPCFENGKGAHLHSLPTEIGFGSTEFHVLRAKTCVLPQFLYRLTKTPEFRRLGTDAMTGAAGQQRVPSSFIAHYSTPLPPLAEQTAIVRYLDHADGCIRHYIDAKERLIGLLKEQRQVVIQRAVTRGLNPDARLKPSGVEWLGDIPAHWEVTRLGNLLRERGETNALGKIRKVLSVLRDRGVIPYAEKGNIGNKQSDDITRYKIVRPDDIVVNCMNVIIGSVGLSQYTGCLSPVYYVLTRRYEKDSPQYLNALFQIKSFQKSLVRLGNGILAHRMRIPMELLKCEPFPRPPLPEQTAIIEYLDKVTADIDDAIDRTCRQVELLNEYRTRLITDVVTGKLDVREAAARLPVKSDKQDKVAEEIKVIED